MNLIRHVMLVLYTTRKVNKRKQNIWIHSILTRYLKHKILSFSSKFLSIGFAFYFKLHNLTRFSFYNFFQLSDQQIKEPKISMQFSPFYIRLKQLLYNLHAAYNSNIVIIQVVKDKSIIYTNKLKIELQKNDLDNEWAVFGPSQYLTTNRFQLKIGSNRTHISGMNAPTRCRLHGGSTKYVHAYISIWNDKSIRKEFSSMAVAVLCWLEQKMFWSCFPEE